MDNTRMEIVDCPNPNCDPEEGCCVCEHTGKVRQWVIDEMTIAQERASHDR
jgi:hypothetical protein